MRTRPIIFSSEMIRAILDGRKSQTRRIVTPAPRTAIIPGSIRAVTQDPQGDWWVCPSLGYAHELRCPYGVPGDRLWVRETWALGGKYANSKAADLPLMEKSPEFVRYRASQEKGLYTGRWRPSIHMPRWASRITLEVVSVRVERVGDISEGDAANEGAYLVHSDEKQRAARVAISEGCSSIGPVDYFRQLWDSINGKKPGCTWADNPYVWVVEFRRVDT